MAKSPYRDCVTCGEQFEKIAPHWNQKTCSLECRAVLREKTKREAVERYQPRNIEKTRAWRRDNRPARLEIERRYRAKKKAERASCG